MKKIKDLQQDVNCLVNLINNIVKSRRDDLIINVDNIVLEAIEKTSKMVIEDKVVVKEKACNIDNNSPVC
jgi:hypothetical protein